MGYTRDAIRLLYAIRAYSLAEGDPEPKRWLKLDRLHVIAHLGIQSGVFRDYDLAPALFPFRGIKMYAMVSQEVVEETDGFFNESLVERLLLNSWFYATVTAVRITSKGMRVLDEELTEGDQKAVDGLIRCRHCGAKVDFAVSIENEPAVRLVMNRVCACRTNGRHTRDDDWADSCLEGVDRIENFFSIGEVEYKAKPFFFET